MATTEDAHLILKLYDLRRESVCRQGRAWFIAWKPSSAEEVRTVLGDMGRQDNAWLRQVTSYWEMAFSIVNAGAIDEELFLKNCGEGMVFCLKCQQFAKQFPEVWKRRMAEAEAFIARSPAAAQKAEQIRARFFPA